MIKVSKKTLVIVLALIAVVATAGTAFAYWAAGISAPTGGDKTANVDIGTADTVATKVTLEDITKSGDQLVPVFYDLTQSESKAVITGAASGADAITAVGLPENGGELTNGAKYANAAGKVIYVQYTSQASWVVNDTTTGAAGTGTLEVEYVSSKVKGGANDGYPTTGLFEIVVDYAEAIVTGTPNTVTFTIFMNEPADDTEYAKVADQEIEFTFSYAVTTA